MDLNLSQALNKGLISSYEIGLITSSKATIYSVRTSIYINNINIKRELIDSTLAITFLQLIYLQNKWLDARNVSFSLSGTAFVTYDPLSIYFDSIVIDFCNLINFAQMTISWNYPEAYLTGTFISKNITLYASATRTLPSYPNIYYYSGSANVSVSEFNLEKYLSQSPNLSNANFFVASASWTPNDENIQLFHFENFTYSIPDNPNGDLYNNFVMDQNINSYRITSITLKNFLFYNMTNWPAPLIYVFGNYNSEGSVTNTEFRNINQNYLPFIMIAFTHRIEHLSWCKLMFTNCIDVAAVCCSQTNWWTQWTWLTAK